MLPLPADIFLLSILQFHSLPTLVILENQLPVYVFVKKRFASIVIAVNKSGVKIQVNHAAIFTNSFNLIVL